MRKQSRRILVPDTIEWSGQRPWGEKRQHAPIPFKTADGEWELKLGCWDKGKGRAISVSTCTAHRSWTMPLAEDAWEFLLTIEAAADTYLRPGWCIGRADFARDMAVLGSVDLMRALIDRVTSGKYEMETYRTGTKLGVTMMGVAGSDRVRLYHKGLETQKKHGYPRVPAELTDVVRVEIQHRKGQLPEEQRVNIEELRRRRTRPEIDPGIFPPPKPERVLTRAMQATRDVDALLLELDCGLLVPAKHGEGVPAPTYGRAPAD